MADHNKKTNFASVANLLPINSLAIPIPNNFIVNFNSLQTTNRDIFSLDSSGVLTLNKKGNYNVQYNVVVSNSGKNSSLFSICALLNGAVVSGSQHFGIVKAGDIATFSEMCSFDAEKGNELIYVLAYSENNTTFQFPPSPLNLGFDSKFPIASQIWSPSTYNIWYNGELEVEDCGCNL